MADTNYPIEQDPVYDPNVRALQDTDPTRASTVFNPLFKKIINNVHAVKLASDGKAPTNHASSDTTHGIATASLYGHPMASSATPLVAGTATVGTDNGKYAREGHVHPAQTSVTGNAGTATKLQTARTINGVSFDGMANITITDSTKAPTSHASSATTYGVASASNYGHAMASSTTPLVAGTVTPGTDNGKFAREGHVHPAQATLPNDRTIDGISFNGGADIHHFSTCSTAAATAAKTVSITGFTRATGARVTVKFTNGNTATNPTLNVTSTGAAAIYYKGANLPANYLQAGIVYAFVFNGSQYEILNPTLPATPTSHASTGTEYGAATESLYGHAMASGATPLVAGTAAVGMDNGKFAREGHVHPAQTSVTGNAGTATKLQTARTINGVSFDGTANITIADSTKATTSHASSATTYGVASASNYGHAMASNATPLVAGTATPGTDNGKFAREGHVHPVQTSVTGSSGSCAGNAATATKLQTARTINGVSFDGTTNITINANPPTAGNVATGNWNDIVNTGFYFGDGLVNQSPGDGNWRFVIVFANGIKDYMLQLSTSWFLTNGTDYRFYIRQKQGGSWKPWQQVITANLPGVISTAMLQDKAVTAAKIANVAALDSSVVMGLNTAYGAGDSVAIGYGVSANAISSVAVGLLSQALNLGGAAYGRESKANANWATAIGPGATVTGVNSAAFGVNAKATHSRSVVLAPEAASTTTDQVLLGTAWHTPYAYRALSVISDGRDKIDIANLKYDPVEFISKLKPRQYRTDYRAAYVKDVEVTEKEIKRLDEQTKCKVREITIDKKPVRVLSKQMPVDGRKAGKRFHSGFVAQEVKTIADEMGFDFAGLKDHSINGGDDLYSLTYEEFIAPMVAVLQVLIEDVVNLKLQLTNCKNEGIQRDYKDDY